VKPWPPAGASGRRRARRAPGGDAGIAPLLEFLARSGLIAPGERPAMTALAGGVSSDIWRVELRSGPVCVKRALARLRVAQLWEAPVERNRYERLWMETAASIVPGIAPRVLAHDDAGFFAMEYLDPARYPLWKAELRAGLADPAFAAAVGERVARVHAATARREDVARRFATGASFHALRLEPYLLAAAKANAGLAAALIALAERTAATRLVLVHGDVSPKNVLVGPDGPVLLDAECAWYGDPAFDLAFCLNHLLLKCAWIPAASAGFAACFETLARAYLDRVDWEPTGELEARAASLLPGLLLARVDGKSPVEYLTAAADKERVRRVARALLGAPPERLAQVLEAWERRR
jgi:aminoglycoside phosphotransferase (APT) family kinase protein